MIGLICSLIQEVLMSLEVTLHWDWLVDDGDPRWCYTRALYGYLRPISPELLYLGKVDGCSVRERWLQKKDFWRDLEEQRGVFSHRVIVAEIEATERLTRQLLGDIESLLIHHLQPWGNIQCIASRGISRPGMKIECRGSAWLVARRTFCDN